MVDRNPGIYEGLPWAWDSPTGAIHQRDAFERAEMLVDPAEANDLAFRGIDIGDFVLARAIYEVSLSRGWILDFHVTNVLKAHAELERHKAAMGWSGRG